MIDVSMDQEFVETIDFVDEYDNVVHNHVKYEWKPTVCAHCKGVGHETLVCRKKAPVQKQWIVKKDKHEKEKGDMVDADGFRPVTKGKKCSVSAIVEPPVVENKFEALTEDNMEQEDNGKVNRREGGGPSSKDG